MNVALLHYSAAPVVGGVESVLTRHARLISGAGHQARLLAGRGEQTLPDVPFIRLPLADSRHPEVLAVKAELDAGRVPAAFESLTERLLAALGESLAGAQVLVAHNVCSLHKNLALTAAVKRLSEGAGAPALILWHHDLAWATPRYRGELHEGFPWELLRTDWPRAFQVTVSELRREQLAGLLGVEEERIRVVPNGLDAGEFLKLEPRTRAMVHALGLQASAPLLLLPVRITPRKNIELALGALAELRREFPHAALVVTGPPGPHNPANAAYLERLANLRDRLGLRGAAHFLAELSEEYLPDAVIADFYRLADALLLPSREEGFGIPILEAGLAGLPVFCADIPPLRALAGENAVYFSPGAEPGEVAGLIERRLREDAVYRLRAHVRRHYSWERIYAEEIAPLLEESLGRSQ